MNKLTHHMAVQKVENGIMENVDQGSNIKCNMSGSNNKKNSLFFHLLEVDLAEVKKLNIRDEAIAIVHVIVMAKRNFVNEKNLKIVIEKDRHVNDVVVDRKIAKKDV